MLKLRHKKEHFITVNSNDKWYKQYRWDSNPQPSGRQPDALAIVLRYYKLTVTIQNDRDVKFKTILPVKALNIWLEIKALRNPFDYLVGIIGFEPIQLSQQIYSLPQLSNSGEFPILRQG